MISLRSLKRLLTTSIVTLSIAATQIAMGQDSNRFEIGLNADLNLANGSPANDILGQSLTGTYRLNSGWLIGARFGKATFDYERPSSDLNLSSAVVVDATADSNEFSVFVERRYNERNSGAYWYWTAGLGINDLSVGSASGMTADGTSYLITTKVDTESLITFSLGQRYNFSGKWSLGYGFRAEQRSGDWTVTDQVSGLSSVPIDGYFVYGLFLESRFRF